MAGHVQLKFGHNGMLEDTNSLDAVHIKLCNCASAEIENVHVFVLNGIYGIYLSHTL